MVIFIIIAAVFFSVFLFKVFQGNNTIDRRDYAEEYINEIESETIAIREKNKQFNEAFNHLIYLRTKAKSFEDNNEIKRAIIYYEKAVLFAKNNSNNLRINNYAHDINRLVILYRKTGQREKEIELLTQALENNIDWNNSTYDKWNERLAKLI